jgi:hypothetical protein
MESVGGQAVATVSVASEGAWVGQEAFAGVLYTHNVCCMCCSCKVSADKTGSVVILPCWSAAVFHSHHQP